MTIDVIGTAAEVSDERTSGCVACVIDVFRATSVISTAMANGAKRVIPITGIEECFELRRTLLGETERSSDVGLSVCDTSSDTYSSDREERVLLAGERFTRIIEGFDLDNSPRAFTSDVVQGATIIMSTTNGTRALNCASGADALFVASLLDARAACTAIAELGKDAVIICSGRHDRFTIEDALCAGKMVWLLEQMVDDVVVTDFAWAVKDMYLRYKDDLRGALVHCQHYNTIVSGGLGLDVDYCLQEDIFDSFVRIF